MLPRIFEQPLIERIVDHTYSLFKWKQWIIKTYHLILTKYLIKIIEVNSSVKQIKSIQINSFIFSNSLSFLGFVDLIHFKLTFIHQISF